MRLYALYWFKQDEQLWLIQKVMEGPEGESILKQIARGMTDETKILSFTTGGSIPVSFVASQYPVDAFEQPVC